MFKENLKQKYFKKYWKQWSCKRKKHVV